MGVYRPPCVFGKSYDFVPTPNNYQGLLNWYRFPNGWFARRNADGTMTGSPNSDFSPPLYDLKLDTDGYLKFQNLLANAQAVSR